MLLRFVPRVLLACRVLLVCLAVLLPVGCSSSTATSVTDASSVKLSQLPAEARQTVALIDKGGPFPYAKDGVVFGNYEKLLPQQKRGYYHEK